MGQDYMNRAAALCPKTKLEKKLRRNHFDLRQKIHEPEYSNLARPIDKGSKQAITPAHKLEVVLEPDNFTEEKFALFENYQRVVHREGPEEITRSGFKRFLCSGLKQQEYIHKNNVQKIGSYHQCYRLDEKLIAMGVLDLLPNCVSSVYLMYHESFDDWNFGKLSALREIALALEGGYDYYYMGYYIHSCSKMRYKGDFRPTYLLDPISHDWDLLDNDMRQRLSARRFVSMSLERSLKLPAESSQIEGLLKLKPSHLNAPIKLGNVWYDKAIDYVQGTGKYAGASNAFEAGTPGVLSLEELEDSMDLGQWRLRVGQAIVALENLISWEESDIRDPNSIKGVIAELAASIGVDLVNNTIVSFEP